MASEITRSITVTAPDMQAHRVRMEELERLAEESRRESFFASTLKRWIKRGKKRT